MSNSRFSKGLTLVTMIIYISAFAVISVILISFTARLTRTNTIGQVTGEVLDNTRHTLNTLAQEIRFADDTYDPTSTYATHPGQLSLATLRNLPTDENITYVDFYVDDDRVYVKHEGQTAQLLNSERIKVVNLTFAKINASGPSPAIQINLSMALDSNDPNIVSETTISLSTTIALRAYMPPS